MLGSFKNAWHHAGCWLDSGAWALRKRSDLQNVERVCLFIGYERSGHSLVGSLLSAHPEMVISHELDLFRYLDKPYTQGQLFGLILSRDHWFSSRDRNWTGYNYAVEGQHQGKYTTLRVIGDKKGMYTALRVRSNPALLDIAHQKLAKPLFFVHHVRYPLDNIATMWRKRGEPALAEVIESYFQMAEGVQLVMDREPAERVTTQHHEDLIASPVEALRGLCEFLQVEPEPGYIQACADKLFAKPRKTAAGVPWTDEAIQRINERAAAFPWLERYLPITMPEPEPQAE